MMRFCKTLKLKGFTLSEVLIVLGTIAIIASMTIPNLIQEKQEQETVSKLKKAYSTLSNAFTLAVQENGDPTNWDLRTMGDATGLANFNRIMSANLQVTKNCGTSSGCFYSGNYLDLNNNPSTNINVASGYSKIILVDGTSVSFRQWTADCSWSWGSSPSLKNICGGIFIDLNGIQKPNKYGVDYFGFLLTKIAVVPIGTQPQSEGVYSFSNSCNKSKSSIATWENGNSCAAWVIYNENMDYLHCDDLSWTGKKTCD